MAKFKSQPIVKIKKCKDLQSFYIPSLTRKYRIVHNAGAKVNSRCAVAWVQNWKEPDWYFKYYSSWLEVLCLFSYQTCILSCQWWYYFQASYRASFIKLLKFFLCSSKSDFYYTHYMSNRGFRTRTIDCHAQMAFIVTFILVISDLCFFL